jgi:hypothetical protein
LDYAGNSGVTRNFALASKVETLSGLNYYENVNSQLAAVTGPGNLAMQYQANFFVGGNGYSYTGPNSIFAEYKYTSNATITYDFDRTGSEVNLTLGGAQIRNDRPSYISSGISATRAALLDSEALAAGTALKMSFQNFDASSPVYGSANGNAGILSDVLTLDGLNGKQFVLQLSYNQDSATLNGRNEDETFLGWFDPTTGSWQNAVVGNSKKSSLLKAYKGSFDQYLNTLGTGVAQLGAYGVDTSSNTVWAVVDHNSLFAVSAVASVPEPETYALLLAGLGLIGAAVKRRKASQA